MKYGENQAKEAKTKMQPAGQCGGVISLVKSSHSCIIDCSQEFAAAASLQKWPAGCKLIYTSERRQKHG